MNIQVQLKELSNIWSISILFKKRMERFEKRINIISGQTDSYSPFSFGWCLQKLSDLYKAGVKTRYGLYKKGVLRTKKLSCLVISIGNVVVGGTGKTPMAVYIARILAGMGRKIAVISRGYKGKYQDDCLIVSDGETIFVDAEECGDEPFMMAQERICPVIVGKDRVKAGNLAIDKFDCDVIILDDGFQHLRLERDIDLLLLDYNDPFGNRKFLPAGRLRETPDMALPRAHAFLFTRSADSEESEPEVDGSDSRDTGQEPEEHSEQIQTVLDKHPETPWFRTDHTPFIAQKAPALNKVPGPEQCLEDYKGRKALAFSGLARNRAFYHTLRQAGIIVLDHLEFKDHYRYKEADIFQISKVAKAVRADLILTTQKDWVKLDPDFDWAAELVIVGIDIRFQDPEGFEAFLNARLQ